MDIDKTKTKKKKGSEKPFFSINEILSDKTDKTTIEKKESEIFNRGDIVKIKNTGELGLVLRSRLFGNQIMKNIIIKTKTEGKKLINIDEIEKTNT